jgi:hypothetical protein
MAMTDDRDDAENEYLLNPGLPDADILRILGTITLAWSHLDELISEALFSLFQLEGLEFTILFGKRDDTQGKLDRIAQILKHRGDKERLSYVRELKTKMDGMRRDRNALTHGTFQGCTAKGENIFLTPIDIVFDEDEGSAYAVRVFTAAQMTAHVDELASVLSELPKHFDTQKMVRLHGVPWRTAKRDR